MGGRRPALDPRWPKGFRSLLERCWHDDKDQRPCFTDVLKELSLLLQEARGAGSNRGLTAMRMRMLHKMRYVKSYTTRTLLRLRIIFFVMAIILFIVGITLLQKRGEIIYIN